MKTEIINELDSLIQLSKDLDNAYMKNKLRDIKKLLLKEWNESDMITTFDNKQWNKQELLDNMYDDSFYYGYLGKNALSSSSAKMLISSPKTYKYVTQYGSDESQALRDGKLFHTMILEPHKLNDLVIVDVATKAAKEYKLAKEKV
jgi:hypothetical protein